MKSIMPLVALVAANVYAQQPLQTIPDEGIPFVQENADKAMKVALLVAGESCQAKIWAPPLTYIIHVANLEHPGDMLSLSVYYGQVQDPTGDMRVDARYSAELKKRQQFKFVDLGIDGHANVVEMQGKIVGAFKKDPPHQQEYLTTLDTVLAICEGKQ